MRATRIPKDECNTSYTLLTPESATIVFLFLKVDSSKTLIVGFTEDASASAIVARSEATDTADIPPPFSGT
jgi:hypothetical protein